MPYIQASPSIIFENDRVVVKDRTNYANAYLALANPVIWRPNNILRFDSFTFYIVSYPSKKVVYYATQEVANYLGIACEIIESPAQLQTQIVLSGKEIGVYKAVLVTIPTAQYINSDYIYNQGDVVFYQGKLYQCIIGGGVEFNDSNLADWSLYLIDIQATAILALSQLPVNNAYIGYSSALSVDYIKDSFAVILKKIACEILKEPTRKDVCSNDLFSRYFMLKSIVYQIESELDLGLYSLELNNMINYVNQYCQK